MCTDRHFQRQPTISTREGVVARLQDPHAALTQPLPPWLVAPVPAAHLDSPPNDTLWLTDRLHIEKVSPAHAWLAVAAREAEAQGGLAL